MAKLPYSRTVNVTLTRVDAFPTRRGFGVPLLLSHVPVAGILDATHRTKVYGSIEEVEVDHISSTEVYAAAEAAFSQNPRPLQIKVGFITFVPATGTAAELKTQLSAIADYDNDWYWIGIVAALRDDDYLDGLVEWTEARTKFAIIDSNDVLMLSQADATNIAARHKGTVERTAVFYHDDASEYPGFALAASLGTRNFDQAESAYTAKYKTLRSVSVVNIGSAAVQAITGFTPALGQSTAAGHMGNAYVDIGGRNFVVEGSTLTPNVFIDEIHASDWIVARTEEETLGVLLNNDRVPYTDAGMELLASGARTVMRSADRAGLIANDIDPETGNYAPAVTFNIPSVFDVPASQRKARIAPEISVSFRYSGAVHYTTINYRMNF
ncbi:structural protein [Aminobacter phage Erebus]|nr:structural protein [Aminobacter phage Erebus]